jgi:hypothetical protein
MVYSQRFFYKEDTEMSISKNLKTKSLIIEIQSGTDGNGKPTYRKKTLSNIKLDAKEESIFAVAEALSKVLAPDTKDYLLDEISILSKEE